MPVLYLLNTGLCVPWHLGRHGTDHAVFVHARLEFVGTQPTVLRLAQISAAFSSFAPLFLNPSALKA